jgi:putative ABC transport system permease protein
MFRSYFTVGLRNAIRSPIHTAINVIGLSIGIACCVLMLLFVQDELSYDRHHVNGERIHRVLRTAQTSEGIQTFELGTSGALGPALKANVPEIEEIVRVYTQ